MGISAHSLHRFIKAAIRKELRLSGKGFENIESARRIFRHDTPLPAEIKIHSILSDGNAAAPVKEAVIHERILVESALGK